MTTSIRHPVIWALITAIVLVFAPGCSQSQEADQFQRFTFSQSTTDRHKVLMGKLEAFQAKIGVGEDRRLVTPELRKGLLHVFRLLAPLMNKKRRELYAYDAGKLWRQCINSNLASIAELRNELKAAYAKFASMPLATKQQRLEATFAATWLNMHASEALTAYVMVAATCNAKLAVKSLRESGWIPEKKSAATEEDG